MPELNYQYAIDGGTVSFEDGTKSAEEYAPARKVRVELNFSVADDEDQQEAIVSRIGDLAKAQVARLLGQTTSAAAPAAPEAGEPASPPARRTRRTKEQIAADEAAKADPSSIADTSSGAPPTGGNTAAGSSADFDPLAETPAAEGGGIEDLSEFDVQPEASDAKPVTDADLNSAVQKKNAEIANPDAIRALIGGYNPDPTQVFQLRQIPADKRSEFLTKLAALTKAA